MTPDERQPRESGFERLPAAGDSGFRSLGERLFLGPEGVRAGWRTLAYVALFFVLFFILQLGAAVLGFQPPEFRPGMEMSPGMIFLPELMLVAAALAAAVAMSLVEDRSLADYGIPWRRPAAGRFAQGALWGAGANAAVVLSIAALGGYSFGEPALGAAEALRYGLIWAAFFCVVGLFEEFFFRGYLQFTLAMGMGFWPAAVLTSLGFGAVHLQNPGENLMGAGSVFAVGMFLCVTLRRTGSLWFAIGWHAAWNMTQTYFFSLPNSGIVMEGRLFHPVVEGPAWLTGGTVGPEGSVFTLLVLAASSLAVDRAYRRRRAATE